MTDSQQLLNDLEIYVAGEPLADIQAWLENSFSSGKLINQSKKGFRFNGHYKQQDTPITVVKNAGNTGYTSVWIQNRNAPWEDDIAMAREAFSALKVTIRCNESAWQQGDDPDQWYEISAAGENTIQWQTHEQ